MKRNLLIGTSLVAAFSATTLDARYVATTQAEFNESTKRSDSFVIAVKQMTEETKSGSQPLKAGESTFLTSILDTAVGLEIATDVLKTAAEGELTADALKTKFYGQTADQKKETIKQIALKVAKDETLRKIAETFRPQVVELISGKKAPVVTPVPVAGGNAAPQALASGGNAAPQDQVVAPAPVVAPEATVPAEGDNAASQAPVSAEGDNAASQAPVEGATPPAAVDNAASQALASGGNAAPQAPEATPPASQAPVPAAVDNAASQAPVEGATTPASGATAPEVQEEGGNNVVAELEEGDNAASQDLEDGRGSSDEESEEGGNEVAELEEKLNAVKAELKAVKEKLEEAEAEAEVYVPEKVLKYFFADNEAELEKAKADLKNADDEISKLAAEVLVVLPESLNEEQREQLAEKLKDFSNLLETRNQLKGALEEYSDLQGLEDELKTINNNILEAKTDSEKDKLETEQAELENIISFVSKAENLVKLIEDHATSVAGVLLLQELVDSTKITMENLANLETVVGTEDILSARFAKLINAEIEKVKLLVGSIHSSSAKYGYIPAVRNLNTEVLEVMGHISKFDMIKQYLDPAFITLDAEEKAEQTIAESVLNNHLRQKISDIRNNDSVDPNVLGKFSTLIDTVFKSELSSNEQQTPLVVKLKSLLKNIQYRIDNSELNINVGDLYALAEFSDNLSFAKQLKTDIETNVAKTNALYASRKESFSEIEELRGNLSKADDRSEPVINSEITALGVKIDVLNTEIETTEKNLDDAKKILTERTAVWSVKWNEEQNSRTNRMYSGETDSLNLAEDTLNDLLIAVTAYAQLRQSNANSVNPQKSRKLANKLEKNILKAANAILGDEDDSTPPLSRSSSSSSSSSETPQALPGGGFQPQPKGDNNPGSAVGFTGQNILPTEKKSEGLRARSPSTTGNATPPAPLVSERSVPNTTEQQATAVRQQQRVQFVPGATEEASRREEDMVGETILDKAKRLYAESSVRQGYQDELLRMLDEEDNSN